MGRCGSGGSNLWAEMVLVARICGQKWFWWHKSVSRNGSRSTDLWAEMVLVARMSMDRKGTGGTNLCAGMVLVAQICGQTWFWEQEFVVDRNDTTGCTNGFFSGERHLESSCV